jgi:hypothetical protein
MTFKKQLATMRPGLYCCEQDTMRFIPHPVNFFNRLPKAQGKKMQKRARIAKCGRASPKNNSSVRAFRPLR